MENPIKMDDLGVPLFSETLISWGHLGPNLNICLFLLGIPFATPPNRSNQKVPLGSDLRVS